jgi:thioredoxin 1
MSQAQAVTEATFEQEVLSSETPVLVDFWAAWCQPCLLVEPALEKIAEERPDSIKLVKVNIDEEQGLAQRYGIASIPAMVLFKDGEPAAAAIGAQPKSALERSLARIWAEVLGLERVGIERVR